MKIKIPYLRCRANAGGRVRYYWIPGAQLKAAGWHEMRLADDEAEAIRHARRRNDEVAAWRLHRDAERFEARIEAGTVAALIAAYKASDDYPTRAASKRSYDQALNKFADTFGDALVSAVTPKRVYNWHAKTHAATPSYAGLALTVARQMFRWALIQELVSTDPTAHVKKRGAPPAATRLWTGDDVGKFVTAADTAGAWSIATAVAVNAWAGARLGDVLAWSDANFDGDGRLVFRQRKTGGGVRIPVQIIPDVTARLAADRRHRQASGVHAMTLIADERTGRALTADAFRQRFKQIRSAAQLDPDIKFKGLRATALTNLVAAGCSVEEAAHITGHALSSAKTITDRHYLIRTDQVAENAIRRRLQSEKEQQG